MNLYGHFHNYDSARENQIRIKEKDTQSKEIQKQKAKVGISLTVQWLGLGVSTVVGPGSIPSWRIKIAHTHTQVQKMYDQ